MPFGREELEEKIKELYGIDKITSLMNAQITKFVLERRWSFLDIARALAYFVEVQGGQLKKETGLGIVPYVIEDARKYFKQLKAQIEKQQKDSEQFLKTKTSSYDIECKQTLKIEKSRRRPLIDLGNINMEENNNG